MHQGDRVRTRSCRLDQELIGSYRTFLPASVFSRDMYLFTRTHFWSVISTKIPYLSCVAKKRRGLCINETVVYSLVIAGGHICM